MEVIATHHSWKNFLESAFVIYSSGQSRFLGLTGKTVGYWTDLRAAGRQKAKAKMPV